MTLPAVLGQAVGTNLAIEKFAGDANMSPQLIEKLAAHMKVTIPVFIAEAYRDPSGFNTWLDGMHKKAAACATGAAGMTSGKVAMTPRKKAVVNTKKSVDLVAAMGAPDYYKQAAIKQAALQAVREVAMQKIAAEKRAEAVCLMNCFLDQVAMNMPMTKQAGIRTLQAALAHGKPILEAIKIAHPHITPEQRGAFAVSLVKAATMDFKKRMKTTTSHSMIGKPGSDSVTGAMYGKDKEAAASFPDAASMNKTAAGGAELLGRIGRGLQGAVSGAGSTARRAGAAFQTANKGGLGGTDQLAGLKSTMGGLPGHLADPMRAEAATLQKTLGRGHRQAMEQGLGDRTTAQIGLGAGAGGIGLGAAGTGMMSGNGNKEQVGQLQGQLQQQQAQNAEYENAIRQLSTQRKSGFRRHSA